MHRGVLHRNHATALSLVTAIALDGGMAVADTQARALSVQWSRGALQNDARACVEEGTAADDAGAPDGSSAGLDAGDRDGGASAAAPEVLDGSHVDALADDAGAGAPVTLADGALFGDPPWSISAPTFDECFAAPIAKYWVDGVSPPEGTACDGE